MKAHEQSALRTLLIDTKLYTSAQINDMIANATRFTGADLEDTLYDGGWEIDADVGIEVSDDDCRFFHAYFFEGLLQGFCEV